jgi:hypothetical protein
MQNIKSYRNSDLEGVLTLGIPTFTGRLTLTNHALYFEAMGVVSYDKAKRFDLAGNSRQTVKSDLSGPWGARLFDTSISCKSTAM